MSQWWSWNSFHSSIILPGCFNVHIDNLSTPLRGLDLSHCPHAVHGHTLDTVISNNSTTWKCLHFKPSPHCLQHLIFTVLFFHFWSNNSLPSFSLGSSSFSVPFLLSQSRFHFSRLDDLMHQCNLLIIPLLLYSTPRLLSIILFW